jgi:Fe-S-cluster-containing hydrogenase component 2/CRP-like cAMP-binding protein
MGRGELMGEYSMLTGQPRNVTARAQTAAVVLEVPEQVMQRMMEVAPPVGSFFAQLNNARTVETVMKRMALFQGIATADIHLIASRTQFETYDRNEEIFTEDASGQPAREAVYIILEGFVKVACRTTAGTGREKTDERIIAYRQSGDYFVGGLDLLGDGGPVTVTAITRTRIAKIPRQEMLAILTRYPKVNQRFMTRLQQYRGAANAVQNLKSPMTAVGAGLQALVGGGVVEGTEVLVIDLDKCVQCNKCEEACQRRHGHSRMNRTGMVVGNISIATACRHCQDPVCLLCSRAGIARLPSGEVYITESCIGCGICAERCPYDNISIVTLAQEDEQPSTWQRFSSFFTKGAGKERGKKLLPMARGIAAAGPLTSQQPLDAFGEVRKKVAVKCDLCAGYENQACIQACPTGAAFRVRPGQFFGSTEEILRRRAQ